MSAWRPLRPELGPKLVDARLQLHHAAQLATALGISYLAAKPDDSHTNFVWIDSVSALASNKARGSEAIRLAVSPLPFSLIVLANRATKATFRLDGRTIADAETWIRRQLGHSGFRAERYTLAKHFTIPPHPVDNGAPFDAKNEAAFDQLAAWYSDAATVLDRLVMGTANAAPVRCWPHHFDIATLIEVSPARDGSPRKTISLGMEPGDTYYAEPYYYASMYPSPTAAASLPPLDGGGSWHTREWIGAVLPASRIGTRDQRGQIETFVASAIKRATMLLGSS